ncbi:Flp pilus assembly protein CpaB [Actibacterium sp. XHP0104]|uniref:Flp pilus assembly protein CpaB n=1 Tax=Actibacterium sp. XHP0104 TaxID=2984335 RepID=UPI0021E82402|nr:Flp pilus assembly protein CpaB [Actibacterium sp. XHP0104]MCV2880517.1 Flp pilus assembly protein CpaB [Actibacterium sp. XHP0104]
MRLIFGVVLIVGLGLAGFAVYMAQGLFSNYQVQLAKANAAKEEQIKLVDIYVAKEDLNFGQRLTLENAKLMKWPADSLPEGNFFKAEDLFPEGSPIFRTVMTAMKANEPLLANKVSEPGKDAGITSRLSSGKRAFTINVDATSGVSGFLRPGDRVDVYWTGIVGNGRDRKQVTKLIEANVYLVAVDQSTDLERGEPTIARTVTAEATAEQAAALAQAQSSGKLSLSLVGALDQTVSGDVEVDQRELLGIEEVASAPEKEDCVIRTRKGADVVEIKIPCTN